MSIQISLNGLSFCILNKTTLLVEFLKNKDFHKKLNPFEVLEQLKECLSMYPELHKRFESVMVIYQNELSSLVPEALFEESHAADYLKFNSKILDSDFISHDAIAANQSVNVYVPYMNINNFIFETFGTFEYKHASTILIETFLKREASSEEDIIYLNINDHSFELVAIRNTQLVLYNSFEISSKEDLIYYVLFAIEQLQFDTETVQLKLMGRIEKGDAYFDTIFKYIRFVTFYMPDFKFKFKPELEPAQKHHNPIILNSF